MLERFLEELLKIELRRVEREEAWRAELRAATATHAVTRRSSIGRSWGKQARIEASAHRGLEPPPLA
jgi:hypothetical protein